ncbi:alpha/beta fold hydrolase [Pseudooceanicola sp.]|uniref:alpha/beta fold hydrolase n=1 Tax=Pseudooceanicola sp. TaxID=1914328 RepID=UPI0035C68A94
MIPTLPQWISDLDARATRVSSEKDGVRMAWRIWGEGEPLLLLHGGSGSWMHWARNIDALTERYRIIAPDLPGYGESDHFQTMSLEEYSGMIAHGLRQIETGPVRIAGFSFGSVIGLGLRGHGIIGPDYVMIGSPGLGHVHPVTDQLMKWRGLEPAARFAAHRNNVEVLMLGDPAHVTEEAAAIQMAHAEQATGRYRGIFHGLRWRDLVEHEDGKLTVMYGDRDALCWRYIPDREAFVASLRREAEFTVIPGMGHWLAYEAAEEVNARLLAL